MDMHSWLVLSQTSDRPMYMQIVDQIKQRVASGDWIPGQEIPSLRGLAADLRVSVITVKRAYSELEQEGVIVTNQGKGSCIADSVPDLDMRMRREELRRQLQTAIEISRQLGWKDEETLAVMQELQVQTKQER